VADGPAKVHKSNLTLAELKALPENAAPQIVSELLSDFKVNRYTCPYVFLTVVMNPSENWPAGGGRPINGGFGTGGGIVILSSNGLDTSPNFQSTVQHEVGHGFGLPHVEVYSHDMTSSPSIMSYNPSHHTKGFRPSDTPGRLIPEDVRGLALNRRAFAKLKFNPAKDVPAGYTMAKLVWLGPMNLPGQPPYAPALATPSGEDFGSKVSAIVGGRIEPSADPDSVPGAQTFNSKAMWQSGPSADGWVMVEVKFPAAVTLAKVGVHSQHSAKYHAADALRVEALRGNDFVAVAETPLQDLDQVVPVPPTKARTWHFFFHAADGKQVVLRGLQFFSKTGELFPPVVPFGN
jgi:hypothetical protein